MFIMKVSLAFNRDLIKPDDNCALAQPLLLASGPSTILGGQNAALLLAEPISPSRNTLFGPRGAVLAGKDGPLIACDTGHHRLMVWNKRPAIDNAPCDFVIGQTTATKEGRNGKGDAQAHTLNVPTGLATDGTVLAVADAWNHRVLIWNQLPTEENQPADIVLGQKGFCDVFANRGGEVGPDTLNWSYGVAILNGNLVVADTGNRRVLIWNGIPKENGTPADLVLGQKNLSTRDENAGLDAGPLGMRWPHSVVTTGGKLLVSDAGNNRIMVWDDWPTGSGVACDYVLGQKDNVSLEHNRANYLPTAQALNMPYGMAVIDDILVIADTANSRLVAMASKKIGADAPATMLSGQPDFHSKGDNRWQMPVRDSLCWPYWISGCDQTLVIADSGNNRILLWELEK